MAILAISHVMKSTGYEHQNHRFRVFRQSQPQSIPVLRRPGFMIEGGIMHFGFKGRSAIYGIFCPPLRPKGEDLLRCGTHYISLTLEAAQ